LCGDAPSPGPFSTRSGAIAASVAAAAARFRASTAAATASPAVITKSAVSAAVAMACASSWIRRVLWGSHSWARSRLLSVMTDPGSGRRELLLLLPLLLLLLLSPWCRRSRMRSLRTLIACLSSSVMMGLEDRKGLPRARRDSNTALADSACSSVARDRAVWTAMSAVRSFSRATARFIVAVSTDTC
jgi:hypothetical protein